MSEFDKAGPAGSHRRVTAFTFKKRTERVDWRKLAAVDVSRIARELDFKSLQENIMNITFCNIEAEVDSHLVDPNFVKLFQLSQLIIEYLMHSQQFLQSKINDIEKSLNENAQSIELKTKELEERQNAINHLKKENRRARKMLAEYQLMMRTGASGMHKCPCCPKVFVSNDYLLAHLHRRHADQNSQLPNGFSGHPRKESHHAQVNDSAINEELLQELKEIKERLASTEKQLLLEKNQRLNEKDDREMDKIKELEERYAKWKEQEQQSQLLELRQFKESVMQELRQVNEEKNTLEQKIVDLQHKSEHKSLVRGIRDEDETPGLSRQQHENDMEAFRRELHEEVNSINTHAEQEMKKMSYSWRKKLAKMKKDSETEKKHYEEILRQIKEDLEAERVEKQNMLAGFEQQKNELNKKLAEREKILELRRGKPPQPPNTDEVVPASREVSTPPPRQEESQENETVTLYVAFNGTNYQVRRNSSSSSRDWSDQFSFTASQSPTQAFNYPIYVFSAGGSPYWRQYISTNPSPPSGEYRIDYMFYTSSVALVRSIACYVLESGSVPVIKSCISKTSQLAGWRSTGIVFYVLKSTRPGSPSKPLSRSGTFLSDTATVTEGDNASDSDEVSVSSLNTATESGKKNLAEAIQLNRSKFEEVQQQRSLPPPPLASAEESRDSESDDERSEDDLGTTLETGTFRPFQRFPEVTTRYNHRPDTLQECTQEVRELFEQSLARRGIQPGTSRLSSKQLESRMESLRSESQGRAKKFKNFKEIRKRKAEEVDLMARDILESKKAAKSGDESKGEFIQRTTPLKPSLKSTASAISVARGLASRVPSTRSLPAMPAPTRPAASLSHSPLKPEASYSTTSITEPSESMSEASKPEVINGKRETTDEGSDEDTDWDSALSGDESPTRQMAPKVSVHVPSQRSQVQELASSLEKSLERSAKIKKPAGAVALIHSTPGTEGSAPSKVEDFDDDSDFLSSSPEPDNHLQKQAGNIKKPLQYPETNASPKKGVKFKVDDFSDFEDSDLDIENIS